MAINKATKAVLKALTNMDGDLRKSYKIERRIKNLSSWFYIKPIEYKIWDYPVKTGDHEVPVRLFYPKYKIPTAALLFFHGGGWVTGSIDSYIMACTNMARMTGRLVASVDYRLAPEHKFPAAVEDCYYVTKTMFDKNSALESPLKDIALIGDSAGGNIAAAVSLIARDKGEFIPKQQILLYPALWIDHSENSIFASVRENGTGYLMTSKKVEEAMELYRSSDNDLKNPYYAPLVAKDLTNQPDTLILTAQYDPLRDEGEYYGEKLKEAGNKAEIYRMKDALHGFISLPIWFSHVRKAYKVINNFLSKGAGKV